VATSSLLPPLLTVFKFSFENLLVWVVILIVAAGNGVVRGRRCGSAGGYLRGCCMTVARERREEESNRGHTHTLTTLPFINIFACHA